MTDELPAYQMMKAGLHMMTMVFARALASKNIRVNTVSPGMVKTDMQGKHWQANLTLWQKREASIPLQRAAEPEEIAKTILFVASDQASYMTGSRILTDGGRTVGKTNEVIPTRLQASL
jgi:NAD(P)-dependent dehydrogenase (short-subunit alcohol dehydrogenase family)